MVMTIKDFVREPRTPRAKTPKKNRQEEKDQHQSIVETFTSVTTRTATETTRNTGHDDGHSPETVVEETQQPALISTSHSRSSNSNGSLLLLHELIVARQFEQALERLYMTPEEATMVTSHNLALHEACKHQAPLELVEKLLEIHPDAVSERGQWGYLPLHFAVCSRAPHQVVARLISSYPSATRHADNAEGKLPLHLAAKWGATEQAVLMLVTVHPKACYQQDASGKTPLDHAQFVAQTSPSGSDIFVSAHRAIIILDQMAPLLMTVTKAAMAKLAHESDAKFAGAVQNYKERFVSVKRLYDEDKLQAEELEQKLRNELQGERDEKEALLHRVHQLQQALEGEQHRESQQVTDLHHQVQCLEAELRQKDQELQQSKQLMQQIQGLLGAGGREGNILLAMDDAKIVAALSPSSKSHSTPRTAHPRRPDKSDDATDNDADDDQKRYQDNTAGAEPRHQAIRTAYNHKDIVPTSSSSKKGQSPRPKTMNIDITSPYPNELVFEINRDDSNEDRDDHLAETRDPPPISSISSPRPIYQCPVDDYETNLGNKMSENDKIRAVASVKDWFASEAEALSQSEDDLLSRLLASEKSTGRESSAKKEWRDRIVDARSPRKSRTGADRGIPSDIGARSYAIRHGYSQNKLSPEQYHHYQQEYESLLSQSRSNLRRRMELSTADAKDTASGKQIKQGNKKAVSKQKRSRHGSKKKSMQKPLEVILDCKTMYKGGLSSSGSCNRSSAAHQHVSEEREHQMDGHHSGTLSQREATNGNIDYDDDHDEDSTLVSGVNE
jgi:hypothetical protein